jgi:rhamnosyltransferase subunit B
MARILLGWELGGNRGHAEPLKALASALTDDGHSVVIAAKEPARFSVFSLCTVMQAPIWPGLLGAAPAQGPIPPANMADILFSLGLSLPGAFASLIRSWDAILGHVRPDVVIADYAPALACATRGRIWTISVGSGFCQPPADMEVFPDILRLSHKAATPPLLEIVNNELTAAGRDKVAAPPAIFATDNAILACFAEFDPYRRWRNGNYALPHMARLAPLPNGCGDEVFVYFHRADGSSADLWNALAATGLKTRVFIAQADRGYHSALSDRGFIVETKPLSWDLIAERSRIVVSHGGLGFTSGALAMSLPHIVVPHDLEKIVTGLTVRKLSVGECCMLLDHREAVVERLSTAHQNAQLRENTRSAASIIRDRIVRHVGRDVVAIIRRLITQAGARAMQMIDGVAA